MDFTPENTITLEAERKRVKLEKEEAKLSLIAEIENAESELESLIVEKEEIVEQYTRVIEAQEKEIEVLKIKFEARFGEENDG